MIEVELHLSCDECGEELEYVDDGDCTVLVKPCSTCIRDAGDVGYEAAKTE